MKGEKIMTREGLEEFLNFWADIKTIWNMKISR